MLFYFDWRMYFRMLRLGFWEKNPGGRRRLLFMLLVVVPVVSTFHAVCFFLDRVFFPGLRRVEVRNPVFIIGHARSGTTLIHRLMSKDERFSCFLLYELFFPSLIEKKLIRVLGACDRRWLGGRIDTTLKRWEARKLAATQDMHRTGLTTPEEDDFIYTFSCASGFWIVLLPYMGDLDFYYVDERPPTSRRRMLRFYEECVKRQLYLNGAHTVHLSKNPTFSGRVESLIEAFPDARFVVLLRNPNDTIPSLLKLLKTAWELRRWDEESIRRSLRVLAAQSFHTYRYPLEALSRHPETKYALVDYRDLIAEPRRTLTDVYARLGFPVEPRFDRVLEAEEKRARVHETTHHYSLEEFGLSADAIHAELADLFDRFGWDDDASARSTSEGGHR